MLSESFTVSILSLISIFLSLNLLNKNNLKTLNINKILSIFFIQILILNLLFSNGTIGNPNNDIKNFIYEPNTKKIIKNNRIFLIGELDNKNLNLLQFYLPNSKLIKISEIPQSKTIYGIVSDKDITQFNNANNPKFLNLKEFKDINLLKIN